MFKTVGGVWLLLMCFAGGLWGFRLTPAKLPHCLNDPLQCSLCSHFSFTMGTRCMVCLVCHGKHSIDVESTPDKGDVARALLPATTYKGEFDPSWGSPTYKGFMYPSWGLMFSLFPGFVPRCRVPGRITPPIAFERRLHRPAASTAERFFARP